jgi:uncharacterized protein (UPF0332 family)
MGSYSDEIKVNVEAAITNLQAAQGKLEQGELETAAVRAAESAFHTASALLLDEDIESSKHGDVITLIHERFVNERKLTKEQGANLSWLFAMHAAEERPASIVLTSEEVHRAVQIAESFFEAAKVILEA